MSRVKIHTDGCCLVNPGGPGSWAVVISPEEDLAISDKTIFFSGGHNKTTNNIQELSGVLEALKWVKENKKTNVIIYSDSKYCVTGANVWVHAWAKQCWKKRKMKHGVLASIKNVDLWKQIYGLYCETSCRLEWVRGHNGDPFNEFADMLAGKAVKAFSDNVTATFSQLDIGTTVCQVLPGKYWAPRYEVIQLFPTSSTVILKCLNSKQKPLVMSSKEFNSAKMILL